MISNLLRMRRMLARPINHYVAVQHLQDGFDAISKHGLILTKSHTVAPDVVIGRVLSVGGRVEAVKPGDIVAYEAQSGHPSQWEPLDAKMFGGDEGEDAYIIPCHKKTIGSSSADMQEFIDRKARLEPLIEIMKNGGGDDEMRREASIHNREISRIMEKQARGGRNMKAFRRRIDDPGRGRGVLAVVEGYTAT
jgi:hypothetical protein